MNVMSGRGRGDDPGRRGRGGPDQEDGPKRGPRRERPAGEPRRERGRIGPAPVRRARQHGLVLAAAAVTILLATAVLAALAQLSAVAVTDGARQRLGVAPGFSVEVDATWTATGEPGADRAVRGAFTRVLAGVPYRTESALRGVGTLYAPLARAGSGAETGASAFANAITTGVPLVPLALPDPGRYAQLTAGRWAAPGGDQVVLSEAASGALGAQVGSVLRMADLDGQSLLSLTVVGIYRPAPAAAALWHGVGVPGENADRLMLVDRSLLTGRPSFAKRSLVTWVALPQADRLTLDALGGLRTRVTAFSGGDSSRSIFQGAAPALAGVGVRSELPGAVDALADPLLATRASLDIPIALLAVLACVILVLTARQLAVQRRSEHELELSRGAGAARLLGRAAAEWAVVALPAAAIGLLLAGPLLSLFHSLGARFGAELPTATGSWHLSLGESIAADWWAAAFALAVHAAAALLPVLVLVRGPSGGLSGRLRGLRALPFQRAGADLALVAAAVLGYLQLRHYQGAVASTSAVTLAAGVDPVLVLVPVLITVAAALLALRLLPVAARLLERTARRGSGLVLPLSGWQVARRTGGQAVPVLVTLLALATGALATTALGAFPQSDRDRAAFAVGADLRVTGVAQPVAARHAALAALPGVGAVTPVVQFSGYLGSTVIQTVAVNTSADRPGSAVPQLRSDLTDKSPDALLAPLRSQVPDQGILLPGRPDTLALDTTLSAESPMTLRDPVQLTVTVQDADGLSQLLTSPVLPDGQPHTLQLPLTSPGGLPPAYPLRITQVSLRPSPLLDARYTLDFQLSRIGALTGGQRTEAVLAAGQRWFRVPSVVANPRAVCPTGGTDTTSTDAMARYSEDGDLGLCDFGEAGDGGLRAQLRTRDPDATRSTDVSEIGFQVAAASATTTVGDFASPKVPTIPALADDRFLASQGVKVGDVIRIDWNRNGARFDSLCVMIVGRLGALPGYDREDPHLLLDVRALAATRALAGATPLSESFWWLAASDSRPAQAALLGRADLGTAQSARDEERRLAADPFRVGVRTALLLVLVMSPLFAVAAFTLHAVSSSRARRREFAVLRALGARRSQLATVLRVEHVAVALLAVLVGAALGLALAAVLLPLTVVDDSARPVFPVLRTAPGWPVAVLVALLTGAALSGAVLLLSRALARVDLVRALRAGEDG